MTHVPVERPITDQLRMRIREYEKKYGYGGLADLSRKSGVNYNGLLRFVRQEGVGVSTHSLDRLAGPLGMTLHFESNI